MAANHHQLMEEKSSSSTSFCYTDVHHHLGVTHLQNFDSSNPEIYNLTSGIQMIGFQPNKPPPPSQSLISEEEQQQDLGFMDENNSSFRPCAFPCEGNERPSQGLSLSLSSSNPSSISLQSFELRHNNLPHHHHHGQRFDLSSPSSNTRDGFLVKTQSFHHLQQQQQQQEEGGYFGKSVVDGSSTSGGGGGMSVQFEMMRNSKYMGPAQELLNEFCNLSSKQYDDDLQRRLSRNKNKEQWDFDDDRSHNPNNSNNYNNNNNASSSSNVNPSLYGVSLLELQKRKTKLLSMLEKLDRGYKNYCEQMKGVVTSFEAVAGSGAADTYSALASRAMSRHFRCLRDSIVTQIKETKKSMGEKDNANNATILGTTRGETPRLRVLDQNLRQQRAYQQMTLMESHPWRPQRGLPERSVSILRAWLFEHFLHPYPSDVDKHILARQTGLTRSQVSNWFINARVRLWKPMVEQMYVEETKEELDKNVGSSSDGTEHQEQPTTDHLGGLIHHHRPPPPPPPHDQKPDPGQLIRIDPDSLSSIVNNPNINTATSSVSHHLEFQQNNGQFIGRVEGFGSMDHLDFPSSSSYNQQHHATSNYGSSGQNDNNTPHHQAFAFGGGGNNNNNNNNVSLTLGLQQHGGNGNGNGNGVSLAFSGSSQAAAASLFYPREHVDDCQPVHQYSLMDGDQAQNNNNLPYRNLMGAQVLHDFA